LRQEKALPEQSIHTHFLGEASKNTANTDKEYRSKAFGFKTAENSWPLYYQKMEQKCNKGSHIHSSCKLNI